MNEVITVSNLTKRFGNFTAVDNISFQIKQGEIVSFLGPNGAGKTTTIKMLNGLLPATSGSILIKGLDVYKKQKEIKKICGYMSQKSSLYPLLTSFENIEFFAGISGIPPKQILSWKEKIAEEIDPLILRQKIANISPGYRQKIALFICLLNNPEIILLDEPTSGVDPEVRRSFWQEIYRLKQAKKTILVSTHNLDEAGYADRLMIINRGKIILNGHPEKLLISSGLSSIEELFSSAILNNEKN